MASAKGQGKRDCQREGAQRHGNATRDGRSGQRADRDQAPTGEFVDAMRDLIAERWGAVWNAVPVALAGDDSEGVHDVRVASRRLRAAMDVAVDCFPARWYRPLHKTAKEITGALGEVRDRDVLLDALANQRESASEPERPGIDRLIERIERERVDARAAMERYLGGLLESDVPDDAVRRFGQAAARRGEKRR